MNIPHTFPPHAIAIVGLAGRFPDARDLDAFWQNLKDGVESLEPFSDADLDAAGIAPALRSDPHYVRRGTVLEGADMFDAAFFGISPREAQILDPQQRIFLECAWEALEHAGHAPGTFDQSVGVYGGMSMNTYLISQILRDPALIAQVGGYQLMLGNDKDFLCTRVSYKLDLHGPSMTIQTACSSSLVAVQVACQALTRGECDMALAGGVSLSFPQRGGYLYQEGMILSPDAHCRPFDVNGRGIRAGAGCGIVVLKRLADAVVDRDTIHAVIRGAAINNDGAGKAGYTAPSVDGQVEAIATAQMLAGVDARSIGYIEAHGTGTPLGDPIEIAALSQVFRATTPDVGFCRLGSLKANIGHLDAAAGIAGLIKAVLVLQHREIPPLVNFKQPNPQLELAQSPFSASAAASPWPAGPEPRRAGVSSFGIGGTNAHVVVEEAPPVTQSQSTAGRIEQLLVLSARSAAALDAASARLADHLQHHSEQALVDVAWTLQAGRHAFAHRRIVVASDPAAAIAGLIEAQHPPAYGGLHEGGARPIAFLLSGQGSQFAGMGAGLYRGEHVFREAVDRCAEALLPHLGLDLRSVMYAPFGDTRIDETHLAQPALFVTEYALAMLWQEWGVRPAALLGHSIGEYVAAHLAGVISLQDALAVVAARGRLMQGLPAGRMAAVHLGSAELSGRVAGSGVEIAAVNGPDLCTVSGSGDAVTSLLERLGAKGVESRLLHTSHAFHSAMMEPVLERFTEIVAGVELHAPSLPYVSNLTGTWITNEQACSPAYYARHLRSTVQFESGLRTLAANPALHFVEVGPGSALASLARMSLGKDGTKRVLASLGRADEKRPDVPAMLEAAGRLWLAGVPIDWRGLHGDAVPRRVALPTYPFERKRYWVEGATAHAAIPTPANALQSPQRSARLDDWFYAPTWMRDDALLGVPAKLQGTWLVLGGAADMSAAVAACAHAAGARVICVAPADAYVPLHEDHCQVRPGVDEDVARLAAEVRALGAPVRGAIVLWALPDQTSSSEQILQRLYHAQVALAAGLGITREAPMRMVVATVATQAVLDEAVVHVGAAAALGPVLALPAEVEGLEMRLVDLPAQWNGADCSEAAAALVAEAGARDREGQIAYRAQRRWLRRYERCPLPPLGPDAQLLKPRGVVLVTGGLGGMGLALALELARRSQARLLLTGRSGLPPRSVWDAHLASHGADERDVIAITAIRAIEAAGGEVLVVAADASDRQAMATAIALAQAQWGPIDAVIHAAGIAGAGRLSFNKSADEVAAVFAPKVGGLDVLVDLLGSQELEFVALMSSINTVIPAAGLADYAAANAVFDAFVDATQYAPGWLRVVALDWGAWRDVGMAAKLEVPAARRAAWQAYLQTAIGTEEGIDGFARALVSGRRRLVVLPFDLNQTLSLLRGDIVAEAVAPGAEVTTASMVVAAERIAPVAAPGASAHAPRDEIERELAAIWVELLGVDSVSPDDDFFELGGHSLLATRVLARLEGGFNVHLALRDIFEASTLRRLADRIAGHAGVGREGSAADNREEIEF